MAVVAARQLRSPAFRRRSRVRRQRSRMAALLVLISGFILAGALELAWIAPASAQSFTYNPRPPRPKPPRKVEPETEDGERQALNGA